MTTVAGCGTDTAAPAPTADVSAYWALRLNYHAVNMATVSPHNTVQLVATPVNHEGSPVAAPGRVLYSAADSNVTVDTMGLVTARYATMQTWVIATLQDPSRNVTHADTVFLRVTDTVPQFPLAALSIQPRPDGLDSAKRSVDNTGTYLRVYATVAGGSASSDTVCNVKKCPLLVALTTSDPTIAEVSPLTQRMSFHVPGHVTLYATTLAYGVVRSDSLPFVVGWPARSVVSATWITPVEGTNLVLSFTPTRMIVTTGATVAWRDGNLFSTKIVGDSVDVVFDDSTAVHAGCGVIPGSSLTQAQLCALFPLSGPGNIPPFQPDTAALKAGNYTVYQASAIKGRTFPIPGTYTFHSRRYPSATGKIIVRSDP